MTGAIQYNENGFFDRLIANRLLLTWFTTISLTVVYLAYAQTLQLLIEEKVVRREFPKETITSPAYSSGNNEYAKEFIPDQTWAADARYQFKDENVFVYTESWVQEEEDKAARLKPFAMLMFDEKKGDSEAPIALVSEEAVVHLEKPFGVKHTDPGRMIAGALEGDVKITGPNGLVIYGRNFFYDETSMNIWSDHEVRFKYDNHQGIARGIEMKLIPSPVKPTDLKPAAEGIREIVLRRDVHMKLALKKDPDPTSYKESRFATVKSAGSFTFNLETNQGTFTDEVRVYHPTSPNQADRLECDKMSLQFVRKAEEGAETEQSLEERESDHSSGKLKFQELVATGTNVVLYSDENQFKGTMTRFTYNEETKVIGLSDERDVIVYQQTSELKCPQITIHQSQDGELDTVICKGAGEIKHRDPQTGHLMMAAKWVKHMKKSLDPITNLQMIELEQQCLVRQPAEEFALAAHMIRLWLRGDLPSIKKDDSKKSNSGETALSNSENMQNKIDPYKMIAERDVAIYSPQLRGKTKRLEIWFDEITKPQSVPNAPIGGQPQLQPQRPMIKQTIFAAEDINTDKQKDSITEKPKPFEPREGRAKVPPQKTKTLPEPPEKETPEPVMVIADLMKLRVHKNFEGKAEVSEVWTQGNVAVTQLHEEQEKPLHITGNQLHIQNKGENDQVLHVVGSPAKINERGFQIEGDHIFLYRLANRAEVQGKGLLLLPVKGGKKSYTGLLSGAGGITKDESLTKTKDTNQEDQDNVLEIHWEKEMIFDGLTANFFGKVRTNMGDNRLRCQEMDVILSDRVSFTEKQSEKKEERPTVHFITCRDGVKIDSNEYLENRLIGIRTASFWQMNVDQKTGNAEARGPGSLTMWRRENPSEPSSESNFSQANSPQKIDTDRWTYTRIDFNGKMAGNVEQHSTTFDNRVQITYGGVKRPLDTINPDKLPPGAGWMRSNNLKLIQHEIKGQKKKYISMLAKGNAEMEGNALIKNKKAPTTQAFIARADTISFDESKDLYMMRSFGNRKATIRRYAQSGKDPNRSEAQQIEFSPTHDRVTLHGVTGIQGLP